MSRATPLRRKLRSFFPSPPQLIRQNFAPFPLGRLQIGWEIRASIHLGDVTYWQGHYFVPPLFRLGFPRDCDQFDEACEPGNIIIHSFIISPHNTLTLERLADSNPAIACCIHRKGRAAPVTLDDAEPTGGSIGAGVDVDVRMQKRGAVRPMSALWR